MHCLSVFWSKKSEKKSIQGNNDQREHRHQKNCHSPHDRFVGFHPPLHLPYPTFRVMHVEWSFGNFFLSFGNIFLVYWLCLGKFPPKMEYILFVVAWYFIALSIYHSSTAPHHQTLGDRLKRKVQISRFKSRRFLWNFAITVILSMLSIGILAYLTTTTERLLVVKDSNSRYDPYQILGIKKDADINEIKQAYRRLSNLYHPDKHSGHPAAYAKFEKVVRAYEAITME